MRARFEWSCGDFLLDSATLHGEFGGGEGTEGEACLAVEVVAWNRRRRSGGEISEGRESESPHSVVVALQREDWDLVLFGATAR